MSTITAATLNELMEILELPGEGDAQKFLARCPQLLSETFGGIVTIPKYRLGTEFEADFLLFSENSGGANVVLVELEPPTARPFTRAGNYARRLNEALNQVHEWLAWIDRNQSYFASRLSDVIRGTEGPLYRTYTRGGMVEAGRIMVEAVIVIGRREHLTIDTDRKRYSLYATSHRRIEITNYDRLFDTGVRIAARFVSEEGTPQQLGRAAKMPFSVIRRAAASSKRARSEILAHLSADEVLEVREAVAHNTHTPLSILDKLALDAASTVREKVAGNLRTQRKTFNALFGDPEIGVRIEVVRNLNCPPSVLAKAAIEENPLLRKYAAMNPNLRVKTQSVLADDQEDDVRRALARNLSLSGEVAIRMLGDHDRLVRVGLYRKQALPEEKLVGGLRRELSWIRAIIAKNPNLRSLEELTKLSRDSASKVRAAVAMNPNLSNELREFLMQDEDKRVREAAKAERR